MKILYLLDSLTPGGTETSTVALASELVLRGHDAHIATLKDTDESLVDEASAAGVAVHRFSESRQIAGVRSLIRELRPDVVHTALYRADQIGRLASFRLGVPVVSSFVSTPYHETRRADPSIRNWKLRAVQLIDAATAHAFVTQFHAVSEGTATENGRALLLSRDRITVVHRGRREADFAPVSSDRLSQLRGNLGISPTARVILNVGRLDPLKEQAKLIVAIEGVLHDHPDVHLLIAGKTGAAEPLIHSLLRTRPDVARRVSMLGHRRDIGELMNLSDVLVVSSSIEGTAGAAIEAMAATTPVVSTRVSGAGGVLEHGRNAVLVEHTAEAIARGICEVLDDPERAMRMAQRGRQDFVERFTLGGATTDLISLYESLT